MRIEFNQVQSQPAQSQLQSVILDRPARQTQTVAGGIRSHGRGQGDRTQSKVYHMTHDDLIASPKVEVGMLQLNSFLVYALIDLGATHFFIACKIVEKLGNNPSKKEKGVLYQVKL